MTPPPARPAEQRKHDTLHRLEHDVDAWVATADEQGGAPYLVPLSFVWDGATLLFATPAASPTGRNLLATRRVRLGIGPTRDVVLVEGTVEAVPPAELPEEDAEIFAGKTGFDPRRLATPYLYFRVLPCRVQAWREADELEGRELMRGGEWLVGG
ncbi:pyridoxamine 5'-phosphate oxidase family protein [Streptomyces sp. HUAS ZL42]|uniref:pyridoxamine 5'-phosphate oxidase family protein n=1 Tax=Streptomyces sp. HUAS ZL42 TaxID=3231715 RepID=UPI00345E56D7